MAGVKAAGFRLPICVYVAPPERGEAVVLNPVLFKPAEKDLVLNQEETQRRALFQSVCMLQSVEAIAELTQRKAVFQTVCMSQDKLCKIIIDSGSSNNLVDREMVEKLGLEQWKHPNPYRVLWLQESHQLLVDGQCKVEFHIGEYKDKVICDIMSMDACDILLGRPWQYDRRVVHFGRENYYEVNKKGKWYTLRPIKDEETAGTNETRSQFLKQVENSKEKVTQIELTTEKATEEEVPASSPAEEVPAAEKTVIEIPVTVETVAQPPAEAAAVEEKVEESLGKEEATAEIPGEKTATVEEIAVKPAEEAPAGEKVEVEYKAEE